MRFHEGVSEPGSTTSEQRSTACAVRVLASPVVLCIALVLVTTAIYWPVLHAEFLNYDDPDYFTSNPHVLSGLTPSSVAWAFTTGHAGNWHPLTWISLMLDVTLFGQGPRGPHLTNLLLHCANAVLLFLCLRSLTGSLWRGFFVAACFALHPLHVESVAWVAERKDVLSTFFGLLALLAYARYANPAQTGLHRRRLSYSLALLFFGLSLASKPMLVTLPFVLLLLDYWPLRRATSDLLRSDIVRLAYEKLPLFALSAVSCVVTFIVQQRWGAVVSFVKMSLMVRIENVFVSYARYIGKALWPSPLATPYPFPGAWDTTIVMFAVALIAGLCAIALLFAKRLPYATVGWFWFLGTLVPVIGLVQVGNQSMADRYTYFPLIGLFIVLAWGSAELISRWKMPLPVAFLLVLALLAGWSGQTRKQISYWENSGTLFRHAVAVTDNNFVAYNNLGTWFSEANLPGEAMHCFDQSLRIQSWNPDALYNLGNIFARAGQWDKAADHYRRSLDLAPNQPDILNNLGLALASLQQLTEAAACFEKALELNPNSAGTHNNLAAVLARQQHYDAAIHHYEEAARLDPIDARIWTNLGDALVRRGRPAEAVDAYESALRLAPGDPRIIAALEALRGNSPSQTPSGTK